MSNRGNQDYFKIQGTPTHETDATDLAHRRLAQQRAGERRQSHHPTGPQAVPFHPHTPPVQGAAGAPSSRAAPEAGGEQGVTGAPPPPRAGLPIGFGDVLHLAADAARWVAGRAAGFVVGAALRVVERRIERLLGDLRRLEQRASSGLFATRSAPEQGDRA